MMGIAELLHNMGFLSEVPILKSILQLLDYVSERSKYLLGIIQKILRLMTLLYIRMQLVRTMLS